MGSWGVPSKSINNDWEKSIERENENLIFYFFLRYFVLFCTYLEIFWQRNLNYKKSINLLDKYIKNDDFPVDAWHYLGLNYGKLKKLDLSSYAFAEKYLLVNQLDNATIHINRAKQLSKNTVLLNKLSDLEYQINKRKGK